MLEYWQPTEPFELPRNLPGLWSYKSATDLYEFKKVCFVLVETLHLLTEVVFFTEQVHADMHQHLPGLDLIRDILSARPANPSIFGAFG
jgi:hypothetical protein